MGTLSNMVVLAFLVTFLFIASVSIDNSFTQSYIDTQISNVSALNTSLIPRTNKTFADFDKSVELNNTFAPVIEGFTNIDKESGGGGIAGFLVNVGDLAIAIPLAVIAFIKAMIGLGGIMVTYLTDIALILGFPPAIIFIGIAGFFVALALGLVTFWRRFDT